MSDPPRSGPSGSRPGRRALFSDVAAPDAGPTGLGDVPRGRRALFSDPEPPAPTASRHGVVVECRTCLARTPLKWTGLGASLIPSLWLPTRPWSRLMRCPACHRVSWCRIEWPVIRRPGTE